MAKTEEDILSAAAGDLEIEEKSDSDLILEEWANKEYQWGWTSNIEADTFEPGLNEDVIRALSLKKGEPQWMLD